MKIIINWLSMLTAAAVMLIGMPTQAQAQSFLYTNNNEAFFSTVSAFAIQSGGGLTEVTGSPFNTGGDGYGFVGVFAQQGLTITPKGPFLFTADGGGCTDLGNNGCISSLKIDPVNGSLTFVGIVELPVGFNNTGGAISLAVTPDGHFLYAASNLAQYIYVLEIASGGQLTVKPLDVTRRALADLRSIEVSPSGKFLAAGVGGEGVAVFSIGADGNLIEVSGSPFTAAGASGLVFNRTSDRLYAGEGIFDIPTVDAFSVADTGQLTPLTGSPFKAAPSTTALNSNIVHLSADEKFLFVSNQFSDSVTNFSVNVGGDLQEAHPPVVSNSFPRLMATSSDGKSLFVANNNSIAELNVGSDGTLTPLQTTTIPTNTFAPAIIGLGTFPLSTPSLPYAKFEVKKLVVKAEDKTFGIFGDLVLGQASDGINPQKEPVNLTIGSYSKDIPPGSFRIVKGQKNTFSFISSSLNMTIRLVRGSRYKFSAVGKAVIGRNPIPVSLKIGNDGSNVIKVKPSIEG